MCMSGTIFPKAIFSRKLTLKWDFLVPRNCDWGQTSKKAVFLHKHLKTKNKQKNQNHDQGYSVCSSSCGNFHRFSGRFQYAIFTGKSNDLFWKLNAPLFLSCGLNGGSEIYKNPWHSLRKHAQIISIFSLLLQISESKLSYYRILSYSTKVFWFLQLELLYESSSQPVVLHYKHVIFTSCKALFSWKMSTI